MTRAVFRPGLKAAAATSSPQLEKEPSQLSNGSITRQIVTGQSSPHKFFCHQAQTSSPAQSGLSLPRRWIQDNHHSSTGATHFHETLPRLTAAHHFRHPRHQRRRSSSSINNILLSSINISSNSHINSSHISSTSLIRPRALLPRLVHSIPTNDDHPIRPTIPNHDPILPSRHRTTLRLILIRDTRAARQYPPTLQYIAPCRRQARLRRTRGPAAIRPTECRPNQDRLPCRSGHRRRFQAVESCRL